ncbi:methyltransferase domain-containing protein [Candidatus Gracilibacteria bacterium]|nr:methyltransferase domain-containing protein [Candidatus Gracilibacteria bacterium]
MYPDALAALTCPGHPDDLLQLVGATSYDDNGALHTGSLRCLTCGRSYAVRDGIADLLGSAILSSPAQLTNALPLTAWAYERTWRPRALTVLSGEEFGYARELPLIMEMLAPQRGGLFVDIACSNGLYARAISKALGSQPGAVVGIDHSLPMLQEARTIAHREQLRISYVRASAQALPFARRAATGVAMGGSLNEIGDAPQALREMRRVLADNGRGALMNLVRSSSTPGAALQSVLGLGGIDFLPLPALNDALQQSGLRIVQQEQHGVVVFSQLAPV